MDGDVIDQDDLLRRCMNDREFVRQMLAIFREFAPKTLRQLQDAVTAADWTAARRHSHTLKGSAANISAGALKRLAQEAEKLIDAGQTEEAGAKIAALDAEMKVCLARIEELLAT